MGAERAGRDFCLAQVHVLQSPNQVPFTAPRQFFVCVTCQRRLPEDQFNLIGKGKPRSRIGHVFYLHPDCRKCYHQSRTTVAQHPLWSPELHRAAEDAVRRARSGSAKRGLIVAITEFDVIRLYYAQDGKCALTGMQMSFDHGSIALPRANRRSMSIDRINSERNYTRDNIQLVCWAINAMKADMSEDELRFWCAKVILNGDDEPDFPGTPQWNFPGRNFPGGVCTWMPWI